MVLPYNGKITKLVRMPYGSFNLSLLLSKYKESILMCLYSKVPLGHEKTCGN